MKKVAVKLTVLAALSCWYVLGLNAASEGAQPLFRACCKNGAASCCGAWCLTTDTGCYASS
jgi:hypothetical protein